MVKSASKERSFRMKIGFIGLGQMGSAVARAVAKSQEGDFLLSNHNQDKAKALQADIGGEVVSNQAIAQSGDLIFLGVKPNILAPLLEDLTKKNQVKDETVWVSMAAGIQLDRLAEFVPQDRLIRMMPNTPLRLGAGMTTYTCYNPDLIPLFEDLMAQSGEVKFLDEKAMDAATAIAGCGPAFAYQFIEALIDVGIQNGLTYDDSKLLASQTLLGAGHMVKSLDDHPAQLRHQVTSPGGSTIAGSVSLEKNKFRHAIIDAVNSALAQNQKLGED